MAAKQLREFSRDEVAKHNKDGDLWTIIDSKVYDLSKFANLHPGGKSVLLDAEIAGLDSTQTFYSLHRQEVIARPQYARLQIGVITGEVSAFKAPVAGALSVAPYGEPQWLTKGFHSPYFNETHYKLREAYRKIVDEVFTPEAVKCEASGQKVSQKTVDLCGELNINAMRIGPGKHLKGRTLLGGIVKPEEFDYFHEMVINQESARVGMRGFIDGFLAGMVIGVPPILNYATPELIERIVPDVLAGKKYLSLAISEAFAGSDVAGLKCKAVLTEDKKHWIVTGTKKWITNGHFSDYFSTACNTGKGLTMILIPRGPGVETKPIKTAYSPAAGTAFVTFDNVKVPVENTLGEVDKGLKVVLSNFNHERWMMACVAVRTQRKVVEESFLWANQRQVFGKSLLEQAVIRNKLAQMVARVEAGQAWLEHITYQMCHMTYAEMSQHLAGPIGLLKAFITKTGQETARDATQIFGGRAITQSGLGSYIEHYHRTVPFDAILGGAEDVLFDLGVKQAMKSIPSNARL